MVRDSKHLVAATQVVAVQAHEWIPLHFKRRERLPVKVPLNRRNVAGQRLDIQIQQHVEVAGPVFRRHLVLVLPAGMISDAAIQSQGSERAQIPQELRNGMPAGIKLSQDRIRLTAFRRMRQPAIDHVTQHRNYNLRHVGRRMVLQDRKNRMLRAPQPAKKCLKIVFTEAEGLPRFHDGSNVRITEHQHRRLI